MVNYSNGKIYKIVPTNGDDMCYIGSTTKQYLSQRMDFHRNEYKKWQKNKEKSSTTLIEIFEKYGLENCKIELIENFPCNSKDELEKREGHYIKTLNCINKRGFGKVRENISETKQETDNDNISVLSTDTTIVSVNYQSDTEEIIEIPKPDPIPSDEYLINLRNEYTKYQYLYTGIDNRIKWNANNTDVNMDFHRQRHTIKMRYILFKIALLNTNI